MRRIHRELLRGAGPVTVLRLLKSGPMYGYELAEALDRRTDGVLAMGHSTLYPLLYSLEAKGLVEADWREADSGRRRKYYGLTPRGEAALVAKADEWRRLIGALTSVGLIQPGTAEA